LSNLKIIISILILSINISFSQVVNITDSIKNIINVSNYDTTSNIVVNYIKNYIVKSNCHCLPIFDEKTNTPINYGTDYFIINGLGEKESVYIYVTFFSGDLRDEDIIEQLPKRIEIDFQKIYVDKGYDYFGIYNSEKFNYLIFTINIKEEVLYFDPYSFECISEMENIPYKVFLLIVYNE